MPIDLFCRVIDNFGDAGVCWRLARQFAALGHPVRLWIDDLDTLARLVPEMDAGRLRQHICGVEVGQWSLAVHAQAPAHGLVIEAFACTLPTAYQASLAQAKSLWINLEYLSAEPWVEGCHGLPSLQPNGVPKYFYFPGFTSACGGLLREPDLPDRRRQALDTDRRQRLSQITGWPVNALPADARYILLFCYPGAPAAALQDALAQMETPTVLLLAGGRTEAAATTAPVKSTGGLQNHALNIKGTVGNVASQACALTIGNLQVRTLPFVPQAQFDDLLWCCDLNFVRGEDSLVRALWARTPLVWQIYPQADDAHLIKLEAWLQRAQLPAAVSRLIRAWNTCPPGHTQLPGHIDQPSNTDQPGNTDPASSMHQAGHINPASHTGGAGHLAQYLADALSPANWKAWQIRAREWSDELATQPDLARQLLQFYQQHAQTR